MAANTIAYQMSRITSVIFWVSTSSGSITVHGSMSSFGAAARRRASNASSRSRFSVMTATSETVSPSLSICCAVDRPMNT
jgi:hypothetical protein